MKKFITLTVLFTLVIAAATEALPKLSSLPSARSTIYLDFDGHYVSATIWNGGDPLDCAPSGMTEDQVTEIFNRVSEDYRPFDINITTDSAIFLKAPLAKRIRVIFTTTSSWYPNVGGVAFLGSFTWGDDTPAFVFTNRLGPFNPKIVAECCSHESGHSVGLSHQSKYDGTCALTATYNDGLGSGETSWAPIMGNSYYKNRTGWNNGPTPGGCNSLQDNLTIITTKNGFGYRVDDHPDFADNNASELIMDNKSFSNSGIITTTTDKDVFEINITQTGSIHFSALPFSVGAGDNGANLDIKITVLNTQLQPIGVYDPEDLLDAAFDTTLTPGRYFLVVDGTGNRYSSDYGSLGSYSISGTFTPLSITPIRNVALSGKVENNKHYLSWNILSDEPLALLDLEGSSDGIHFKSVANFGNGVKNFSYAPFIKGAIFYRVKVTSVTGETVYSNVIILKPVAGLQKSFTISTKGADEVVVTALKNYKYQLADASGKIMANGANPAGIQTININNYPKGLYIIQIISQDERITERIIR